MKANKTPMIVRKGVMTYSQYRNLHEWVVRRRGKPQYCAECGSTIAKFYQWSNISGEYRRDLNDWQRMCASCHRRYDFRNKPCPHGHVMDEANTYIGSDGSRSCRACQRARMNKFNRTKAQREDTKSLQ